MRPIAVPVHVLDLLLPFSPLLTPRSPDSPMADPTAVASAFITHFNTIFDSADRTQLAPLYVRGPLRSQPLSLLIASHSEPVALSLPQQESSMLSYEGTMLQGQAAIINHYANPVGAVPPCPARGCGLWWGAKVGILKPVACPQESGSGISRFQTRTAVTTIDAQPIPQSGGLMCYCTGNIIVSAACPGTAMRRRCY